MSALLADPLAQLIASMFGVADGSEWIVVVSVFVDEAGTGDEPNIILAALVGDLNGWIAFNAKWQRHLNDAQIDFAHFAEMRKGLGQFEGWPLQKKKRFAAKTHGILKECCMFGFTISLNKKLYQERYRSDFPKGHSPDSAYALCAREVFGQAMVISKDYFGYEGPVNFIFESGHRNSANAAEVFEDLKKHSIEAARYGFFTLADKAVTRPLQAADQIASVSRRNEPEAVKTDSFVKLDGSRRPSDPSFAQAGRCPIFYLPIEADALQFHRKQKQVLRAAKNRAKNQAKKGLAAAANDPSGQVEP